MILFSLFAILDPPVWPSRAGVLNPSVKMLMVFAFSVADADFKSKDLFRILGH